MLTIKSARIFAASSSSVFLAFLGILLFALSGSGDVLIPIVNGPFAYVGNQTDGTVTVINASSGSVVATVALPSCGDGCTPVPAGLAVTPHGDFVYVAIQNDGAVAVIQASNNTVLTTIPLCSGPCMSSPVGVAIAPDGLHAYVTDAGQQAVLVIDTNPFHTGYNTVVATIPFCDGTCPSNPAGLAVTPDGTHVYVADTGEEDVVAIDTSLNEVSDTISLPDTCDCTPRPVDVAITPDGTSAYVTDSGQGIVEVISTSENTVSTWIPLCSACTSAPEGIATTPNGARAYVTDTGQNAVVVLDTNPADELTYNTVIDTLSSVGSTPNQIAVTPDGTTVYAPAGGSHNAAAIYTSTNTVQTPISVGSGPFGIAIGPEPSYQQQTLNGGAQTITFPFFNGGASISFTVPAGWCSPAPCTVRVIPKDEPDSVWQSTDSSNYPGTDIAPVTALPGGGNPGGDGVLYTVACFDQMGNTCTPPTGDDNYTTSMMWDTLTNICGMAPGLGKEEATATTWENILGTCSYDPDPAAGTSGSSRDGLSKWASFYHISGSSSASVSITTPTAGAYYLVGQTVDANYSCTGSSLVECAGTVASGSPIDTSSAGTKSFTAEADVNSGPTASQTVTYNVVTCHDVSFAFNPSTVAAGKFTLATATVRSCSGTVQKKTVVQFILTGPFGRNCGTSQTLMFATPPFTLDADTDRFTFPLFIPKSACAGTYTVTAKTSVAGTLIDSSSSSLVVTAH